MPWKKPNRPTHEITQSFNDGIVRIYSVKDGAAPGYRPVPILLQKGSLRYQERYLGINRLYSGRQNQVEIQRVLRVMWVDGVTSQDRAITEDGEQYRIDSVQNVLDVYPSCMDLTLAKVEQKYEVQP